MTRTAPVTVALTGSTGYAGGALAQAMVQRSYRVRALTRRSPIAYQDLVGAEWIHGENIGPAALDTLVAGTDTCFYNACFHSAAMYRTAFACELACAPLRIPPPLHRRRLTFSKHNRAFTIDKARKLPGYEPRVGLEEGFRRTVSCNRREGLLR